MSSNTGITVIHINPVLGSKMFCLRHCLRYESLNWPDIQTLIWYELDPFPYISLY